MLTFNGLLLALLLIIAPTLDHFLRPPHVERSRFPRCHSRSLPAGSVQGPEQHEAIVGPQLGGGCSAAVTEP